MKMYLSLILLIILTGLMPPNIIRCQELSRVEKNENTPFYLIGCKTIQPFGLSAQKSISYPSTRESYRKSNSAVTFGFNTTGHGLDISLTAYSNTLPMKKRDEFSDSMDRINDPANGHLTSWMGNIRLERNNDLSVAIFYDTDPGDLEKNDKTGMIVDYQIGKFLFDAKYIYTFQRENIFYSDNLEYQGLTWFGSLAYQFREPLRIAIRYEAQNDDASGVQNGAFERRISLGGKFILFENGKFFTNFMAEYRKWLFKKIPTESFNHSDGEFFTGLEIAF